MPAVWEKTCGEHEKVKSEVRAVLCGTFIMAMCSSGMGLC